ncbi:hypothetical protein [Sciscionella marina]|uniref:hypothetical protein n=1 Tax=Sciscionella marina TaxID=508770 RepID=UPI00037267D0|nr:hypothetical protein [Sciscionella marina]
MQQRSTINTRLLRVALLAAVSTSACTVTHHVQVHHRRPATTHASQRYASPNQVCAEFATTLLSWNTNTEDTPQRARTTAARRYLIGPLSKTYQQDGIRDDEWPQLQQSHARVEVTTRHITDDPPDTRGNIRSSGVLAQRSAVTPDGARKPLLGHAVYCTLQHPTGQPLRWRINQLSISDAGDMPPVPGGH